REVDATEKRLDTLAYFDPVSGLPNRHACNEALEAASGSPRSQGGFAVLLLDLDDFKYVNDTLGHEVGDALLKQLATRIRSRLRDGDRSFRLGGDEFLVLAPCPADPAALRDLGMLAVQALEAPMEVGAHTLHARISVGVAHFPTDAEDVSGLLRAADTAMYEAKKKGKNTCVVFHPSMQRDGDRRMRIEQELRSATARGEFHLLFQPIIDLRERRMVGVEALVRWRHPDLGLVSPTEFIPLAERSGSILEIGQWVLKEACRQMKVWTNEGLDDIYVAVNVSARQVKRGLAQQIGDALAEAQLPAHHLEIELTEHSLVEDIDTNVEQLRLLERAGVRIAIDDFGTGLSSLAYLKRLPIEKLKIDRTFVKDLPDNRDDSAIVSAIVSLAKTLNLTVVAEGVETEAQRDHLQALGCDNGQGFFYSRPVEPGLITKFAARSLRGPSGAAWQPSAFAAPSPLA
ncbi:MAG TPA: EAL domain-containing protein, partial [Rubrivivax sp.]|nr:EAL domain-containing protein [Rubrivivax sp.]